MPGSAGKTHILLSVQVAGISIIISYSKTLSFFWLKNSSKGKIYIYLSVNAYVYIHIWNIYLGFHI